TADERARKAEQIAFLGHVTLFPADAINNFDVLKTQLNTLSGNLSGGYFPYPYPDCSIKAKIDVLAKSLPTEQDMLEHERASLSSNVTELKSLFDAVSTALKDAQALNAEQAQNISRLTGENTKLNKKLEERTTERDLAKKESTSKESTIATLRQTIAQQKSEINGITFANQTLSSDIAAMTAAHERREATFNSIDKLSQKRASEIEKLKKEINRLEDQLTEKDTAFSALNKTTEAAFKVIEQQAQAAPLSSAQTKATQAKTTRLELKVAALKRELAQARTKIGALEPRAQAFSHQKLNEIKAHRAEFSVQLNEQKLHYAELKIEKTQADLVALQKSLDDKISTADFRVTEAFVLLRNEQQRGDKFRAALEAIVQTAKTPEKSATPTMGEVSPTTPRPAFTQLRSAKAEQMSARLKAAETLLNAEPVSYAAKAKSK
ncbi:MAG: hypothetical protein V4490_07780, partial [Pseudomonadota bacterium]